MPRSQAITEVDVANAPNSMVMNKLDALNYYTVTKKYDLAFPRLTADIDLDVVVISGGFSGINTALELAEQGITNIVVLEDRHLGYGGTGRNGGQVMAGIGHDLNAVKRHVGPRAWERCSSAGLGAGIIRERIARYGIDADFCQGYGYLAYNRRQVGALRGWCEEFQAVEPDVEIELLTGQDVQKIIGSKVYAGAIKHGRRACELAQPAARRGAGTRRPRKTRIFELAGDRRRLWGAHHRAHQCRQGHGREAALGLRQLPEPARARDSRQDDQHLRLPDRDRAAAGRADQRISPIRGAYSDIRPVIDYFRVTRENRLLYGSATRLIDYIPDDLAAWNFRN
ncbi:MAG: FAD-binding oxidoreductase [Geminicoccaceae bacterium]